MNRRAAFRIVMGNPRLRRVTLAFVAFNLSDWARWLAILIYAFSRGGVTEAGLVSLAQLIPAAIVGPIAASLGDRFQRHRVLLGSYVGQAALMTSAALAILSGAPSVVVYALAIAGAAAITLTRPAHWALLPQLARTPAELTAANAASGSMEGIGILMGQAAAGILIEFAGTGVALIAAGAIAALAALTVAFMVPTPTGPAAPRQPRTTPLTRPAVIAELMGGISAVVRLPGPRTIVLLLGAGYLVWGAVDILVVVLVLRVFESGESGVGFLNALMGAGGLVGSAVAFSLVGQIRLARPFALGLLVWAVPLIVIGILPIPAAAALLLVLAGAGRTVLDVVGRTLLQRAAPDAVLSRVLGVLEGLFMAAFGLGAILTPWLISVAGPRGAFVVVGLLVPFVVVWLWTALKAIDATAVVPVREIALLRAIDMFSLLAASVIERLASYVEPIRLAAGSTVIRQGDAGDRFYVVASGDVDVLIDDRYVRTEGPGAFFGEIALLLDIPRTATVVARTDVELMALDRAAFLGTLSRTAAGRMAANQVAQGRLGSGPSESEAQ